MAQRVRHIIATIVMVAGVGAGLVGLPTRAAAQAAPDLTPDEVSTLEAAIEAVHERVREVARIRAAEARRPDCSALTGGDIPQLVADVFRCRLREAGFAEADVDRVAAEAVTVAHCESLWDPAAVVFDGRYLHARHPATGMFYSAAGVFQFIRKSADRWIEGGYANVHHPTANIEAAARLYLHNVQNGFGGWDDWACAAANDGFRTTSVLPGWPGGPAALPDWAHRY